MSEAGKSRPAWTVVIRIFYAFFSLALTFSSFFLTFHAFKDYYSLFLNLTGAIDIQLSFKSVILITLSIAIFDLAKTIFEEEVLFEKDPMKPAEVRRTLTRFLATITIAASIEILMLIFKFSMTQPQHLFYAALLLVGLACLVSSLGVYTYLGHKSERRKSTLE